MNAVRAIEQIELAVRDWTVHVERCDVCLAEGTTLCYEGQYLADEVVVIRDRAEQAPRSPWRAPTLAPRRRPIFPGVPA